MHSGSAAHNCLPANPPRNSPSVTGLLSSVVEATLQYLKNGPLKDSSAKQINALWDKVKNDSILDNFQAVFGGSA